MNVHRRQELIGKFAELSFCNPFSRERRLIESNLLGVRGRKVWSVGQTNEETRALESLAEKTLAALTPSDRDQMPEQCAQLVFYVLYYRHLDAIENAMQKKSAKISSIHEELQRDVLRYGLTISTADLLAVFFQIRRAFEGIYSFIVGSSDVAGMLRASIWESIFTHDMQRYQKTLVHHRLDFPTIIMGPSGTGKELVARAIAMGRFIPYDARKGEFVEPFDDLILPLNLSALSPTLIESELFGHRRGAFTGAVEDRIGWLEVCSERGVVFLDEIGELELSLQVKLLRVLQDRRFQRIGETKSRTFKGKIVAATNRVLEDEMEAGRFRADLYYRLCADIISTPSLSELIDGDRDELRQMIQFIAAKLLNDANEREQLVEQVIRAIQRDVGWSYAWPGNFRELEQSVHNVLIRGRYKPATPALSKRSLSAQIDQLELTADQLIDRYCALAYERCGSYVAASQRLKIDRRTLRSRCIAATKDGPSA